MLTNSLNGVWNGNRGQTTTTFKSRTTYRSHRIWNNKVFNLISIEIKMMSKIKRVAKRICKSNITPRFQI